MAPTIIRRRAESSTALKAGLISVAVVAGVTLAALLVYLALFRLRNRQYEEACKRDPYLTRKEFARRRKLSSLQRIEEEEAQRQLIIRKTLTSRASSRNASDGGFIARDPPDSLDEHPALREQQHQRQKQQQRQEEDLERDQSDDEDQELMADREREWKRLEAGLEAPETNVCENSPLIDEHPAMQETEEDDRQRKRSNSAARAPLLSAPLEPEEPEDPESQRTSLWDRRLSDNSTASFCRTLSRSPPPRSSVASTPRPARAHPYIVPPPAQLLHLSSPGQPKAINIRHTPTLVMVPSPTPRAASFDTREDPTRRHRSPSNPSPYSNQVSSPPAPRARSSSNASVYSNPPSNPPTGPLPPIPTTGNRSRSSSNASSQTPFPNLISPPPPAALPHSPSPKKDGFLSPDFVHPAMLDKHRNRSLSWDVDRPSGHQRAHSHEQLISPTYRIRTPSPSVSPRRKPVPQRANSAKPLSPVVEPPTPVIAGPADPPVVESVGNAGPADRTLTSQGGAIVEQVVVLPDDARIPSPAISDRDCLPSQAAARHRESALLQQHSDSQLSGRRDSALSMRGQSPPPAPIAEPVIDPRRFSFEEGSSLKALSIVPVRSPSRKPIPEKHAPRPSSPMGQPQQQQQPEQQHHLPVPRLNRDRTRSVEYEMNSPPRPQLNAEDVEAVSRRLRSRSFEDRMPVARGKWQLQVSILDQTGSAALRNASSLQDLQDDESDSDSDDDDLEDETISAEPGMPDIHSGKVRVPTDGGSKQPSSVASSSPALSQQTDASTAPSTANTPATPDLPLCRANFASPIREKQIAESPPPVAAAKRSPPLFYSPPPGPTSPSLFVSPMSPGRASAATPRYMSISPQHGGISPTPRREWQSPESAWAQHEVYQQQYRQQGQQGQQEPQEYPFYQHQRHHSASHDEQVVSPTCVELEYGRDTMKQAVESPVSPVSANTKLSFRLSGPPDLGPGFLNF